MLQCSKRASPNEPGHQHEAHVGGCSGGLQVRVWKDSRHLILPRSLFTAVGLWLRASMFGFVQAYLVPTPNTPTQPTVSLGNMNSKLRVWGGCNTAPPAEASRSGAPRSSTR